MTKEEEIRAKSMELALSFMGIANELPITMEFANESGYGSQELERVFNSAVWWSKRFKEFIQGIPISFQETR